MSGSRLRARRACAALGGFAALLTMVTGCAGDEGSNGDTIKIGAIVQEKGLISLPEARVALEAFAKYQNKENDGIDGKDVEIVYCAAGDTAETAVACAQEMVNNDEIHVVIENTTNPAAIADVLAKAKKPVIVGGNDITNMLKPGVFVFEPGTAGIADAILTHTAKQIGVKHVTIFHADDPSFEQMKPAISFITDEAGLTVDKFVPLGLAEADLSAPISAGIQDESEAVVFIVAQQQCIAAGEALQTLDIDLPVIGIELCLTEEALTSGAIDNWYVGIQSSASAVDGGKDADEVRRILDEYGDGAAVRGLAGLATAEVQIAFDVLDKAGAADATDASALKVLEGYKSSDILGFEDVACPGPGAFVGACNPNTYLVQVKDGEIHQDAGFVKTDFKKYEAMLGG